VHLASSREHRDVGSGADDVREAERNLVLRVIGDLTLEPSAGVEGMTTFRPGTWATQASSDWECCAAAFRYPPIVVLRVSGTVSWPPVM
jgi:hypothetical protein